MPLDLSIALSYAAAVGATTMKSLIVLLMVAGIPSAHAYQELPIPQAQPDIDILCSEVDNPAHGVRFRIWSREKLVRTRDENHTQRAEITDTHMRFNFLLPFTIDRTSGAAYMDRFEHPPKHYRCAPFNPATRKF